MDRRTTAFVLIVGGSVLMLVGLLALPWWTGTPRGLLRTDGELWNVGLTGLETCNGGECRTHTFEQALEPRHGTWVTFGATTFYGGLVAVGVLLLTLVLGVVRRELPGGISPTRLGVGLAAATFLVGVLFVFQCPKEFSTSLSLGLGMPAFVAGTLLGGAGCLLLLGHILPAPLAEPPVAPEPARRTSRPSRRPNTPRDRAFQAQESLRRGTPE